MQLLKPEIIQGIIKDFTTTKLCTYQIAHKFNLNQRTIKSIITKNMGSSVFDKKEALAYSNLIEEIKLRVAKNLPSNQIACDLGISRSSCFRIVENLVKTQTTVNPSSSDNSLHIIAVENDAEESAAQSQQNTGAVNTKMLSQKSADLNHPSQTGLVQESHLQGTPSTPIPYSHSVTSHHCHYNRSVFHNRGSFPDFNKRQMVCVNLNGFSIRFDSNRPDATAILNRIIKVILEQ